ncbi:MAG: DUF4924 family protein [Flavobacteriales bacterium]
MLTAQQKKQENIVEYLLYMYCLEDMIRSLACDANRVCKELVPSLAPNASFIPSYEQWYSALCQELLTSGKKTKGHLAELEEIATELVFLHQTLMVVKPDEKYQGLYETASVSIDEFSQKSGMENHHPVLISIHAMHMKLQLKLRGKDISNETEMAFDSMRIMLAYLAVEYKKMRSGSWDLHPN